MKKAVINALPYKPDASGIGVLIGGLFGTWAGQTETHCTVLLPQDAPPFPNEERCESVRIESRHRDSLRRLWFQSFRMGRRYAKDAILLTTDSKTPFFLPGSCRLYPVITDLALYRMGEVYRLSRRLWWRFQYRYVRCRAWRYGAISEFTAGELTALFGIPRERIDILPCACAEHYHRVTDERELSALREKYALPGQYLLFVGSNNPRKNLARLLRAYDLAAERDGTLPPLVIAGASGWKFHRDAVLGSLRHAEKIQFIGYVPDADMSALYSGAELFLFPSLYEGFGIPILEAQRCGTPVLTGNNSSLPEVGGNAALYVDVMNERDIADGILRLRQDAALRQTLRLRGYENEKRFSWENSARKLENALNRP